jgi:hypothetical protein
MATLIKTLEQFKAKVGGTQKEMFPKTWMPYVVAAEKRYILPEIGEDFYDELVALTTPEGKNLKLIDQLQEASAYYSYMSSIISMSVSMGDAGIMQNTPANTATMTKWQYVTLAKDARDKADSSLERALKWLEKNKADFQTWTDSDEYKESKTLFVSSPKELTDCLPLANNSYIFYKRLVKYIENSEKWFVAPLIGKQFLATIKIKAATANPQWTTTEEEMLDLLRHALTHHAFAESVMYLNINQDFRVVAETDGIINENDLDPDRRTGIKVKSEKMAETFGNKLLRHLNENASAQVYADFFNSGLYKPTKKPIDKLPATGDGLLTWI